MLQLGAPDLDFETRDTTTRATIKPTSCAARTGGSSSLKAAEFKAEHESGFSRGPFDAHPHLLVEVLTWMLQP